MAPGEDGAIDTALSEVALWLATLAGHLAAREGDPDTPRKVMKCVSEVGHWLGIVVECVQRECSCQAHPHEDQTGESARVEGHRQNGWSRKATSWQ
jgi:hypothetical protein